MAWRKLQPNDATWLPRVVLCVDTETLPSDATDPRRGRLESLRLGVVRSFRYEKFRATRQRESVFKAKEVFWTFLKELAGRRHTTWVVAHNAGFDLSVLDLWGELDRGAVMLDPGPRRSRAEPNPDENGDRIGGLFVTASPPTIIACRFPHGQRFVIVDTLNYFRCSLAELGRALYLPKLAMPDLAASDEAWIDYCRRDCEIVESTVLALFRFCHEQETGMFRYTAPGLAMGSFRHRFMRHNIVLHDEPEVRKLERRAYYGGVCTLYKHGEAGEPVHKLDVCGLYPSLMKEKLFPCRLTAWEIRPGPLALAPAIDPAASVADVILDSPTFTYPAHRQGKTVQATGLFATTLCGPELERAVKSGHVREWGSWATYEVQPIFRDFVNHWWKMRGWFRSLGNEMFADVCKLLLVSLPGKFGQRSPQWLKRDDLVPPERWGEWSECDMHGPYRARFRAVAGEVFQEQPPGEHPLAFPAIAGFVTAYGREFMRQAREIAGPYNTLYQIVDALFETSEGKARLDYAGLLADYELGKFRHEESADNAAFWGPNYYRFGEATVLSGRKATAVETMPGWYSQDVFEGLESAMLAGPVAGVYVKERLCRCPTREPHGTVGANGWIVPPRLCDTVAEW